MKSVLKNCLAKSSCRSAATGWISTHSGRKHKEKSRRLCVASWNVQTLLDNKTNPKRRSAIIAHAFQKYNIDIAAMSETRVHGNSQFEEAAAGYTFFLTGHPTDGPSQAGGSGVMVVHSLHRSTVMFVSCHSLHLSIHCEQAHTQMRRDHRELRSQHGQLRPMSLRVHPSCGCADGLHPPVGIAAA